MLTIYMDDFAWWSLVVTDWAWLCEVVVTRVWVISAHCNPKLESSDNDPKHDAAHRNCIPQSPLEIAVYSDKDSSSNRAHQIGEPPFFVHTTTIFAAF
jgi:hypothetical protein